MQYGREEPVHPVLRALSLGFAAVSGCIVAVVAFLLVAGFREMLQTALPGMTTVWFFALGAGGVGIAISAFSVVYRKGKGLGSRVYAGCGIGLLLVLVGGELTGTIRLERRPTAIYIVPGPYERPATHPPVTR